MPKVEDFQQENTEINGIPLRIVTYKIGDRFFCHVENKDPGATIARGEGPTREDAKWQAVSKVNIRLQ
ncbi:MAG TPA: hypothetical protein VGA99_07375 [bacterium]